LLNFYSEEEDEELRERIIKEGKFYGIEFTNDDDDDDGEDHGDIDDYEDGYFVTFDWRLNPSKKHVSLALSNNNLTVTHNVC